MKTKDFQINRLPLISVVVLVYNGASFILCTLNSIENQTYKNIELFVVDDFSSDNSFEIIEKWATGKKWVRIFKNGYNKGIVKNCNHFLKIINGEYFQFFGHDDLMYPTKIENQVAEFNQNDDNVALIFSDVSMINESGGIIERSYLKYQNCNIQHILKNDITKHLLHFCFIPAPSVLLKTECVKSVNSYDENLLFEDLDLWIKLSLKYKFIYLDEINTQYRIHPASQMQSIKSRINNHESLLNCLEKYRGINKNWDHEINYNIYKHSIQLLKYNHPNAKKWVKRRFKYFKDFKSIIYYVISLLPFKVLGS